jgi:hypothetical protein
MFVGTLPVVPLLLGAGSIAIFAGLALTRRGRDDP